MLFPERVADFPVLQIVRDPQGQHQQRDRDREDPVAEGDDAPELELVALPLLRYPLARHPPIIQIGLDGTVTGDGVDHGAPAVPLNWAVAPA